MRPITLSTFTDVPGESILEEVSGSSDPFISGLRGPPDRECRVSISIR